MENIKRIFPIVALDFAAGISGFLAAFIQVLKVKDLKNLVSDCHEAMGSAAHTVFGLGLFAGLLLCISSILTGYVAWKSIRETDKWQWITLFGLKLLICILGWIVFILGQRLKRTATNSCTVARPSCLFMLCSLCWISATLFGYLSFKEKEPNAVLVVGDPKA